jgi:type IV pilus assembly protein PilA
MHLQRGFSLIELLIVIAIILVIAAIAIPNLLQSRTAANEASAVGSIQAIKTAEFSYYNTYPTVGYAVKIGDMGGASPCVPAAGSACLLDTLLSTSVPGSLGKSGYQFLATGIITGGATNNTAFVAGASPLFVGHTGNRDFCSTDDGVLRQQQAVAGDLPVNTTAACIAFAVAQ